MLYLIWLAIIILLNKSVSSDIYKFSFIPLNSRYFALSITRLLDESSGTYISGKMFFLQFLNPEIRKEAFQHGAPIVPRKMTFFANQPKRKAGRQLVVKSDNSQGLIIVEGYSNPEALPDLKREWALPGTQAR